MQCTRNEAYEHGIVVLMCWAGGKKNGRWRLECWGLSEMRLMVSAHWEEERKEAGADLGFWER